MPDGCRVRPETRNPSGMGGQRAGAHPPAHPDRAPRIGSCSTSAPTTWVSSARGRPSPSPRPSPSSCCSRVAVLNGDDPAVRAMAARTRAQVPLVGEAPTASFGPSTSTSTTEAGPASTCHPEGQVPVALDLVGRHHVGNALAVAAVAREVGMSLADIADTLVAARPISRWRMEVTVRSDGRDGRQRRLQREPGFHARGPRGAGRDGVRATHVAVLGLMLE